MPRPNLKENAVLLPNMQSDSVPFLLTRPTAVLSSDVVDDDAETTEIPVSRSVPPHAPPAAVVTTEHELPSVIVDAWDAEIRTISDGSVRANEVDGLLVASERLDFPVPAAATTPRPIIPVTPLSLPLVQDPLGMDTELTRLNHAGRRSARKARVRALLIAAAAALTAAGGTFVGLKVFHVSGSALGAALHVVR